MPFLVKRGPRFVTQPGIDYGGPGEIAQNPRPSASSGPGAGNCSEWGEMGFGEDGL